MANAERSGVFFLQKAAYGTIETSYWGIMVKDICTALVASGQNCTPMTLAQSECYPVIEGMLIGRPPPHYVINFNVRPVAEVSFGQPGRTVNNESVWVHSKIPLIILCLDHPVHIAKDLSSLLDKRKDTEREAQAWVGIMEEGHRSFLLDLGWPHNRIFICPQGGPPPSCNESYRDGRRHGILFTGSLLSPPVSHQEFSESVQAAPNVAKLLGESVERILDGHDDVYTSCRDTFAALELPIETLIDLTMIVDSRTRLLRRFRVLNALSAFPITFYGNVVPDAAKLLPHCTFKDGIGLAETLEIAARSRIVVNDTINLRDSALIRLFYAMSLGTIVASDVNRFLENQFSPQRDFIALGPQWADANDVIERVLHDDEFAQEMADSCTKVYSPAHQWQSHIKELLSVLNALPT